MTTRSSNVLLAAVTALAWGVILLVPGSLFWDDWVTVGGDVVSLYRDLGLPWVGYLANAISAVGPVAFKIVGVACAVIVALAARGVAARGLGLDASQTWIVAALVALLPFNVARASVAVLSTYSISLALFFVAWWMLVAAGRRRVWTAVAAVLLLLSFTTGSLLPFVAVPVAHLALLELDRGRGFWRGVLRFAGRYWYVLITPVVFWVIRTLFLTPRGVYADYNSFIAWSWPLSLVAIGSALLILAPVAGAVLLVLRIIRRAPSRILDITTGVLGGLGTLAIAAIVWIARGAISPGAIVIPALLAVAGLALVVVSLAAIRGAAHAHVGRAGFLAAAGLVIVPLGALPYLLVGKIPNFIDWETRHQLLLPVGAAVLLLAGIVAVDGAGRTAVARVAGFVAVGVSAAAVLGSGVTLVADWNKQQQVIDALADVDELRDASTVVVIDETIAWNYGARQLRFYEPIGWLHAAFGDRTRFAIDSSEVLTAEAGGFNDLYDEGVRYGFQDWDDEGPVAGMLISARDGATWWDLLIGEPAIEVASTSTSFEVDR